MTSTMPAKRGANLRRMGKRAAGAVSGQLSQALASFVLQVAASRTLGASGLGVFAMLYGAIVLGTAVSTGMVGDSLTVLDRAVHPIRVALARWCLLLAGGIGVAAAVLTVEFGWLSLWAGVFFGLAAFAFMVEDALRRMLMATMRFWSLPLVDGTSLVVSLVTLLIVDESGARLTMAMFMLALFTGQVVATMLAIVRLPAVERKLSPFGTADMRAVFGYGFWRSLQLSVRPATLAGARLVISAIVGVAAYGQLEAARVFMAPALLMVSGMGSFLLPMYVAQRHQAIDRQLKRADRATVGLLLGTLVVGAVGTLAAPVLGSVITGGHYRLDPVAVLGWAVYAASSAALLPYTGLAAVLGRQRRVTAIRTLDPVLSLGMVAPAAAIAVDSSPYALAVGSFLAGLAVRFWVLRSAVAVEHDTLEAGCPDGPSDSDCPADAAASRPARLTRSTSAVGTETDPLRLESIT